MMRALGAGKSQVFPFLADILPSQGVERVRFSCRMGLPCAPIHFCIHCRSRSMTFRSGASHRQCATILAIAISAAFAPPRLFGGVTYTEDCSASAAAGSLGVFYDPGWSHEWQLAGVSGAGQVSGI